MVRRDFPPRQILEIYEGYVTCICIVKKHTTTTLPHCFRAEQHYPIVLEPFVYGGVSISKECKILPNAGRQESENNRKKNNAV